MMCVDYINIKKACPNDSYPLSWINELVDATSSHKLLTFMDALLGCNQFKTTLRIRSTPLSLLSKVYIVTRSYLSS